MATHSVFLPGKSQEEPGGLQSIGLQKVRCDVCCVSWPGAGCTVACYFCVPASMCLFVPWSQGSILRPQGVQVRASLGLDHGP